LRTALEILKRIHYNGANAAACHAQMYIMGTLLKHGSADQKQKFLPRIATGEIRLQAFGVTEPNSGTDTLSLRTFAKKTGSGYVINGQKIWTSRAEYSDLLLLLARTTPAEQVAKKTDGLSVFLIDLREVSNKHIQIKPIRTMINHSTTELFIEDLQVDQNTLIGKEGEGFKYILSGMNAERVLIAAECIGDAQWFINEASNYANNRILFNAPISKNQGIQFPISKSYAHMKAAELMVHHAAEKFDSGVNDGESANIAKLLAADSSWMAAEACLQTFGGFGFAEEYDVERKYRETRLYQVAPISTNMILSYIAEKILGMPKSYG
jgi:alkylation response protein AidB-like acyl-CoA dehydrogenase